MAKTVLLVGTRKGLFLIESDDRRDWSVRGPLCEAWPIYNAILGEDGTIYAAAASEWLGSSIWRSSDLGETWQQSSEGLNYEGADGLKLNKISSLAHKHGKLYVGAESVGLFESTDGGETFSLVSTLDGAPGREVWNDPSMQPPGHLGLSAIWPYDDSPDHIRVIVQGNSIFDTEDGGKTWTPSNKGLRREWPPPGHLGLSAIWPYDDSPDHIRVIVQGNSIFDTQDGGKTWTPSNKGLRREWPPPPNEEVGFCVHKLAPSPDEQRWYQQNHVGTWRSDDGGRTWNEITEGLPTEFGFACAAHPHDRETFYTTVLDPGHGRVMPDGQVQVWRTRDAGSSWQKLTNGLPERDAYVGVLRDGMTRDEQDDFGLYFGTSTGQIFASLDEGESWTEVADYLPSIQSVRVATVG